MYRFTNAEKLYNKLLPSFTLIASRQPAKETWNTMPSIADQAHACAMKKSAYIEAVKEWAWCMDIQKDVVVYCLENLAKIEKSHFNVQQPKPGVPEHIELVEEDDHELQTSDYWQVRIPTPFGLCGIGGKGDVITDTDFLNLNGQERSEKIRIAENIFLPESQDKIRIANEGSAFTKEIRKKLLSLPKGYNLSYGMLAKGKAARAVGSAMRNNMYVVVVPCHRVLGHNFSLSGYAGGQSPRQCARKVAIILYERLNCEAQKS